MIIEIRKSGIFVDGKEASECIFKEREYTKNNVSRVLDFRVSDLKEVDNIIVINKSGRNYNLISTDDWNCTLKTSQEVEVKKGLISYMSQKSIS